MPKQTYTMQQDADRSWSVLVDQTGAALRLAGIPQTGLSKVEAEIMLELLSPKAARTPERDATGSAATAIKRAAA